MSEVPTLPAHEVSRRIVTGMGLVYDLFNDMVTLFRFIHQGLEDAELGLMMMGGKGYLLPRSSKKTAADRFVRTDMGLLAGLSEGTARGDAAADDESADEGDGDEDEESESDTRVIPISPTTKLLGIRAVLHDPFATNPLQFEPVLIAALLTSIVRKQRRAGGGEAAFEMKRRYLRRFVKQLTPGQSNGASVEALIPRFDIAARIQDIHEVPVASIDSERALQEYLDRLIEMVEAAKA